MKVIRNVNETLKDDLALELQKGSMLSIVAADFLCMPSRLCVRS